MTFEQWMKRPVFVVQCKTMDIAKEIGLFGEKFHLLYKFRVLPNHRDAESTIIRNKLAKEIYARRALKSANKP